MPGKTAQDRRSLQRKRRRTSDPDDGLGQHSTNSNEHDHVESETILTSSATNDQVNRPEPKRLKTHRTGKVVRESIQVVSSQESAYEEGTNGTSRTPEKHVRFPDRSDDEPTTATAPETSTGVSRASLSPSIGRKKPNKPNHGRASLPPTLTSSPVPVQELNFSPLRTVIDERMRRRLRRSHLSEEVNSIEDDQKKARKAARKHAEDLSRAKEQQIKELQLQLELQRQMGLEVGTEVEEKMRAQEDELRELKQKIREMQESQDQHEQDLASEATNVDDDLDAPTFVDPDDIPVSSSYEQNAQSADHNNHSNVDQGVAHVSTQVSFSDAAWEHERQAFEQALVDANRKLSDAQSILQILAIELSNLGFNEGVETSDSNAIIDSIRDAFQKLRSDLENVLPDAVSNATSNKHLLILIVEHVRPLLDSLQESRSSIEHYKDMEELLKNQCNGLLDKITDSTMRTQILEDQWQDLDARNDRKERRIVELDDLVASLRSAIHEREAIIQAKDDQITPLEEEVKQQSLDLNKLRDALESYRDEVKRLESLITRLEKDHAGQIANMKSDHEGQVNELKQALEVERQHLGIAEYEIHTKTSMITALELRLEEEESRIDELKARLADAVEETSSQQSQRQTAEAEVAEQATLISDLQDQATASNSKLKETKAQLSTLKQNLDTERRQREMGETALDGANDDIQRLEQEVQNGGVEANQLRLKIFELQTSKDEAIKELNNEATQMEQGLRHNLTNETAHRKKLDQRVAILEDEINQLKDALETKEHDMAEALHEKDTIIEAQNTEITHMRDRLSTTAGRLDDTTAELDELKLKTRKQISGLRAEIHNASQDYGALTIERDLFRNAANEAKSRHTQEVQARDEQIAQLTKDRDAQDAARAALEADKASLERRVEAEAEAMLQTEARSADEIAGWRKRCQGAETERDDALAKWEQERTELTREIELLKTEVLESNADYQHLAARFGRILEASSTMQFRVEEYMSEWRGVIRKEVEEGLKETEGSKKIDGEGEEQAEEEDGEDEELNEQNLTAALVDLVSGGEGIASVKKIRQKTRKLMRDSGIGLTSDSERSSPQAESSM
ncbi:MAG: hypothetical protein M1822_000773 [Bathelium mastoideum]|nr:MAG: hypothetical protein M1822_000773 [Bathelium mastoideum]